MEQLPITFNNYVPARSRRTDPPTSRQGAARVDVPTLSERVVQNLRDFGPADSDELAMRMGLKLVTVSPRMRPLERLGRVCELEVRNRKIVWAAT